MPLCDFHIHSTYSDGELSIPELVDLYGLNGFGAIAITDHLCETDGLLGFTAKALDKTLTRDTFPFYIEEIRQQAERAWRLYNMVVIPGVEITKNSFRHEDSAHILGLGVDQYINPNLSIERVCKAIRELGGVTVAAHPVSTRKVEPQTYYLWNHRHQLYDMFDAWEIASGQHIFTEVAETQLPVLANSDLHKRRQMSSWKTVLKDATSVGAVLEQVKNQNLDFQFFNYQGVGNVIEISCNETHREMAQS
tara:strand:+ start:164384 stop:165133 length:750 start_codon:yes stop_codon:yes gene_type:complete